MIGIDYEFQSSVVGIIEIASCASKRIDLRCNRTKDTRTGCHIVVCGCRNDICRACIHKRTTAILNCPDGSIGNKTIGVVCVSCFYLWIESRKRTGVLTLILIIDFGNNSVFRVKGVIGHSFGACDLSCQICGSVIICIEIPFFVVAVVISLRHTTFVIGITFRTTIFNLDNGNVVKVSSTKCRLIIINTAYLNGLNSTAIRADIKGSADKLPLICRCVSKIKPESLRFILIVISDINLERKFTQRVGHLLVSLSEAGNLVDLGRCQVSRGTCVKYINRCASCAIKTTDDLKGFAKARCLNIGGCNSNVSRITSCPTNFGSNLNQTGCVKAAVLKITKLDHIIGTYANTLSEHNVVYHNGLCRGF